MGAWWIEKVKIRTATVQAALVESYMRQSDIFAQVSLPILSSSVSPSLMQGKGIPQSRENSSHLQMYTGISVNSSTSCSSYAQKIAQLNGGILQQCTRRGENVEVVVHSQKTGWGSLFSFSERVLAGPL